MAAARVWNKIISDLSCCHRRPS